ncbi:tigger transposable element-derived protein 1-like [Octopus sinensis]|uniref:Tigger transposable element-derived protein 1-like n=1 Tax=Octopus sinensis TaxID=2607531 RepID=A0A6P7SVD6_9MOLL|nr:tigger transposable element-derived protein 1-like [Octopus sinensis]
MRFKERRSYNSIKKQDGSASADEQAEVEFPNAFKKTGFFPNRFLTWTKLDCIGKNTGPRRRKLFPSTRSQMNGDNCAEYFKFNSLLVYHARNPRALKTIPKTSRLVILMANSKAWVSVVVFKDWFFIHFIQTAEKYCKEKAILFKVLLTLAIAPGHPQNIVDFDLNVTIVYLPPNTTFLLQSMGQGITAIFKRYYMKRCFWKKCEINKAVQNIAVAWNDVQSTAMNGVWKKLCPQFMNDFNGFYNVAINKTLVTTNKGLEMDLEEENFTDLFQKYKKPITNEHLIELHEQQNKEGEVEP